MHRRRTPIRALWLSRVWIVVSWRGKSAYVHSNAESGLLAGRLVWVCCWLGVIVAGCTNTTVHDGMPTRSPTRALLPFPTRGATRVLIITLQPPGMPGDLSAQIRITVPLCVELAIGDYWCIGTVTNLLDTPIRDVVIEILLSTDTGIVCAVLKVRAAYLILYPKERSPYGGRLSLESSQPNNRCDSSARIVGFRTAAELSALRATLTMMTSAINIIPARLETRDIQLTTVNSAPDTRRVSGSLIVPHNYDQRTRLTIAIYDHHDQLINFRQDDITGTTPNQSAGVPFSYLIMTPDRLTQPSTPGAEIELRAEVIAEPLMD